MKKILSTLLIFVISISFCGCNFAKSSNVIIKEQPRLDLTALVLMEAKNWLADYDFDESPAATIENVYLMLEEDNSITESAYETFINEANEFLAEYVVNCASYTLSSNGYAVEEMDVKAFIEEVLGMELSSYVDDVMTANLPTSDEIADIYGLNKHSEVSVAPNGVVSVAVENEHPKNISISIDGNSPSIIRGFDYLYEGQTAISMRDLAVLLKGTNKAFSLEAGKSGVAIETGNSYKATGNECKGFEELGKLYSTSMRLNDITLNDEPVRYYNLLMKIDGEYDCYMRLIDAAMMLNLDVMQSGKDSWAINTSGDFKVNLSDVESYSYFESVNSVLIGDAATGEIYYSTNADEAYAIASITKLMNYTVVMDAVSAGAISETDMVTISERAHILSVGDDGTVPLSTGQKLSVNDLLHAMLIPSSNECSLALAEHVAGSEEAFVEMMNAKAEELGLTTAEFHTCNGLPVYSDNLMPRKMQNYMSSKDLFTLISYILDKYPQIVKITKIQVYEMHSTERELKNTNPLLFNMTGVVGLKSGTTNAAGCCQTIFAPITDVNGIDHKLVTIELGAETPLERNGCIELITRLGIQIINEETGLQISADRQLPKNADQLMILLLAKARLM